MTLSEENYLKCLFHLEKHHDKGVPTNGISEAMRTKASSVTDMVKKLSEKDLVIYKKYQGVYLSDTGRKTALQIVRKHRLWEVFLVDKLSFSWDEVHEVAEQLEHIKSDKLITELDKFLEFPKRDPHGDPIPDAKGNFHVANKTLLSNLSKGERGTLVGVKDTSTEFLKYLDKNNIALGKTIEVLDKEEFDESMLIQTGGKTLRISPMVTVNIFIKQ